MRCSFSFPVNLSLEGRKCLVFGLGEVGRRKLKSIVAAGAAEVRVLDLLPREALKLDEFSSPHTRLIFSQRCWREEDLEDVFLVFASSSNREKNQALCSLCQTKNILCDNASSPGEGNFISPARVDVPPLMLAISAGGSSPLLTAKLKRELEPWLRPWALMALLMGKLRPYVLALEPDQAGRREVFREILDSPIPVWLEQGKFNLGADWLHDKLPLLPEAELKEIFRELECSQHTR